MVLEATMRSDESHDTGRITRRAWKPPMITTVTIRAETRSAAKNDAGPLAQPQPPAAPATKLGFAFEMAFPLSARFE